jgi:hypothetical protein
MSTPSPAPAASLALSPAPGASPPKRFSAAEAGEASFAETLESRTAARHAGRAPSEREHAGGSPAVPASVDARADTAPAAPREEDGRSGRATETPEDPARGDAHHPPADAQDGAQSPAGASDEQVQAPEGVVAAALGAAILRASPVKGGAAQGAALASDAPPAQTSADAPAQPPGPPPAARAPGAPAQAPAARDAGGAALVAAAGTEAEHAGADVAGPAPGARPLRSPRGAAAGRTAAAQPPGAALFDESAGEGPGSPAVARAEHVQAAVRLENMTGRPPELPPPPVLQAAVAPLQGDPGPADAPAARPVAGGAAPDLEIARSGVLRGLWAMVNQRGGVMTMRLHPPELGNLRIEMALARGAVSAGFHAATPQAGALLEGSLALLRAALESHGLIVERIAIHAPPPGHALLRQDGGNEQGTEPQQRHDHDAAGAQSRGRRDADHSGAGRRPVPRWPARPDEDPGEPFEAVAATAWR